jgi:hypothetical protein
MAISNALLCESQSNDWLQRLLRGDNWRRTIGSNNDLLDPVFEAARMVKTESLEFFSISEDCPLTCGRFFRIISHPMTLSMEAVTSSRSVRRHLAKSPGQHND